MAENPFDGQIHPAVHPAGERSVPVKAGQPHAPQRNGDAYARNGCARHRNPHAQSLPRPPGHGQPGPLSRLRADHPPGGPALRHFSEGRGHPGQPAGKHAGIHLESDLCGRRRLEQRGRAGPHPQRIPAGCRPQAHHGSGGRPLSGAAQAPGHALPRAHRPAPAGDRLCHHPGRPCDDARLCRHQRPDPGRAAKQRRGVRARAGVQRRGNLASGAVRRGLRLCPGRSAAPAQRR